MALMNHTSWLPSKENHRSREICFEAAMSYTSWWFQPIWKNISQIGLFPQVGVKMKNVCNHHLGYDPRSSPFFETPSDRVCKINKPTEKTFLFQENVAKPRSSCTKKNIPSLTEDITGSQHTNHQTIRRWCFRSLTKITGTGWCSNPA